MNHDPMLSTARRLALCAAALALTACSEEDTGNGVRPGGSSAAGVAAPPPGAVTAPMAGTGIGMQAGAGAGASAMAGAAGIQGASGIGAGDPAGSSGAGAGGSGNPAGSAAGGGGAGAGGTAGGAGTAGSAGSAGSGEFTPPTGANSIAYIGCSMAWNIGNGYKRVGGTIMWNSDSYQTSAMVVQNWTDPNSSSWRLFDQKMNSVGGKDTVKAIMIQICIFSSRATDAELRSMISSARQHVNPGTHIYIVGQPVYEAGHECFLAGDGGAKWTDDQAQALAADSSVNQDLTYLGQFLLDSTKGQVSSDSCHASPSGEDELGRQAMAYFGG